MTLDIGQRNKTTLTALLGAAQQAEPADLSLTCSLCKLSKMYDSQYVRLSIFVSGRDQREAVSSSLRQLDFKPLLGAAPAGAMERLLQQALENELS